MALPQLTAADVEAIVPNCKVVVAKISNQYSKENKIPKLECDPDPID